VKSVYASRVWLAIAGLRAGGPERGETRHAEQRVTRVLRASPIILLLALVMTGAPARGQGGDREPPLTVSCYDPERRIIQTVRRYECRGRIVDPEEAARISRRLRLERARRVGETAGEGSDTPAPRAGSRRPSSV